MSSVSKRVILIMGVAGSGKTTIGRLLADALHCRFVDADDFHSVANIAKMRQGLPLTDADRRPWLMALRTMIVHWLQTNTVTVLACSALKSEYRDFLIRRDDRVVLIYLKGSRTLLHQRLQQRQGHYMNLQLLQSQLEVLEEPTTGFQVEIDQTPGAIVQAIEDFLSRCSD